MSLSYLSVCSGVEAASVAWHGLGWRAVGFAEIAAFPSAVLAHHYGSNLPGEPLPASGNGVPNFGDFTSIDLARLRKVDLLVGGTPCQAFSHMGKRLSLADARGNLSLAYVVLAHELARSHGLEWAVWENVPGVLSTDDNAFGCFMGALVGGDGALDLPRGLRSWPRAGMVAGPRARAAWRVLDAQFFGVPQRRERVFVVASFGNGDPASVLFEPARLRRDPASRRKAPESAPLGAEIRARGGRGPIAFGGGNCSGSVEVAASLLARGTRLDFDCETFVAQTWAPDVAHTLRAEGFDASEDGTGRGVPLIAHAFDARQSDVLQYGDMTGPLDTDGTSIAVLARAGVRRLTPRECERLQGFPDDYTLIAYRGKPAADGPRYMSMGNSMAVPVMRRLGELIAIETQRARVNAPGAYGEFNV